MKGSIWTLMQVLFFGCFFLGILSANLVFTDQMSWICFLNDSNMASFSEQTGGRGWFLCEILIFRLLPFLFFLIFGFTKPGLAAADLYAGWKGYSFGFLFSSFISRYGAKGIAVFAGMATPHYLFYVPAYLLLFRLILRFHKKLLQDRRFFYACVMLICLVIGILLEYCVNPAILVWTAKFL